LTRHGCEALMRDVYQAVARPRPADTAPDPRFAAEDNP